MIWRKRQGNFSKHKTNTSSPTSDPKFLCGQIFSPQISSLVCGRQVASPTIHLLFCVNKEVSHNFLRSSAGGRLPPLQKIPLFKSFFAEGKKTICYIVYDGFRQPTPDSSEPNGDGRIPVSMRGAFFKKRQRERTLKNMYPAKSTTKNKKFFSFVL